MQPFGTYNKNKTNIPYSGDTSRHRNSSESRVSQEVLRNKYRYSTRGHVDDDHFDIQLTAKNMCIGMVKDRHTFIIVVDSGATQDIITQKTIDNSPYLSSLEPAPCEPLSFTVAGGEKIVCRHKLNFELNIQGAIFDISIYYARLWCSFHAHGNQNSE